MTDATNRPEVALSGELVLPDPPRAALPAHRWPAAVVALRSRVAELARDPAVIASVGAGLAASALRYAVTSGGHGRGSAGSVVVTGFVLQHVHVVHHVVHHVVVEHRPTERS